MDHARTRRQDENTDPAFWMPKLQLMPQIYAPLHPHRLWHPTFDGIGVHNIPNIGQATTTLEGAVTLPPSHLQRMPPTQNLAYTIHPADRGDRSSGDLGTTFASSSHPQEEVFSEHNLKNVLQFTGHSGQIVRVPTTGAARTRSMQHNNTIDHGIGYTLFDQPTSAISSIAAQQPAGVDPSFLNASNDVAQQHPYSIGRPSIGTVGSFGAGLPVPSEAQRSAIASTNSFQGLEAAGSLQLNEVQLRMVSSMSTPMLPPTGPASSSGCSSSTPALSPETPRMEMPTGMAYPPVYVASTPPSKFTHYEEPIRAAPALQWAEYLSQEVPSIPHRHHGAAATIPYVNDAHWSAMPANWTTAAPQPAGGVWTWPVDRLEEQHLTATSAQTTRQKSDEIRAEPRAGPHYAGTRTYEGEALTDFKTKSKTRNRGHADAPVNLDQGSLALSSAGPSALQSIGKYNPWSEPSDGGRIPTPDYGGEWRGEWRERTEGEGERSEEQELTDNSMVHANPADDQVPSWRMPDDLRLQVHSRQAYTHRMPVHRSSGLNVPSV
ncbi:hypothetical protein FA95DRAFT_1576368 [Auriscalpium vulgare]|uniref:Uncharacterized protein n=1 Tax=Auriscalpium vulgare TaxID=40419 RepID=A0ACB8RB63_9AGAM|nr:hypothetical protein FA95DRAFT_1576368 [Auriscalpium vulgare]